MNACKKRALLAKDKQGTNGVIKKEECLTLVDTLHTMNVELQKTVQELLRCHQARYKERLEILRVVLQDGVDYGEDRVRAITSILALTRDHESMEQQWQQCAIASVVNLCNKTAMSTEAFLQNVCEKAQMPAPMAIPRIDAPPDVGSKEDFERNLSGAQRVLTGQVVRESVVVPHMDAIKDIYHPLDSIYKTNHTDLPVERATEVAPLLLGLYASTILAETCLNGTNVRRVTVLHALSAMGFGAIDAIELAPNIDESFYRLIVCDIRVGFLAKQALKMRAFMGSKWARYLDAWVEEKLGNGQSVSVLEDVTKNQAHTQTILAAINRYECRRGRHFGSRYVTTPWTTNELCCLQNDFIKHAATTFGEENVLCDGFDVRAWPLPLFGLLLCHIRDRLYNRTIFPLQSCFFQAVGVDVGDCVADNVSNIAHWYSVTTGETLDRCMLYVGAQMTDRKKLFHYDNNTQWQHESTELDEKWLYAACIAQHGQPPASNDLAARLRRLMDIICESLRASDLDHWHSEQARVVDHLPSEALENMQFVKCDSPGCYEVQSASLLLRATGAEKELRPDAIRPKCLYPTITTNLE